LSQCTIYLASSPKGNAAYNAINEAQAIVRETGNLGVPLPLRNAPTALMKQLGYGEGYLYSHLYPGNFAAQEFLPEEIKGTSLFQAGSSSKEQEIASTIKRLWGEKYK
jgi:putative ATPase